MKSALPLLLATASIATLSGCGDPAPSTKIAPDQPPMSMSKMSPEDLKKIESQDHSAESLGGGPSKSATTG